MQRFLVVFLVVALLASLLPPPRLVFAATFVEDTQSEFDAGTHSSTVWNTDNVQMMAGNISGSFISQVLDGGTTNIPRFDTLAWSEGIGTVEIVTVDVAADVYNSIGAGATWRIAKDDYNAANNNGADGMAVDNNGILYIAHKQTVWSSSNRGVSWTQTTTDYNTSGNQNAVEITTDSNSSIYIFNSAEAVWKSTDGGVNFTRVNTDFNGNGGTIKGATHAGTKLFTVDAGADVWISTDGGINWTNQNTDYNSTDGNGNTTGIAADSSGNIYILDDQAIWKSTNDGANWTKVATDYNSSEGQSGLKITGDGSGDLYIAEEDEDIWKSTNGGASWTKIGTDINGGNGNIAGIVAFSVSADVTYQVRSGSTNPPTGSFVGPDGTSGTSFTTPGGQAVSVANNRYFQYKISYTSDSANYSPTVSSVTVTYTLVEPITSTGSVDTSWIKGGQTSKNITFTVTNDSGSSAAIQWVRFTRPSSSYTSTGGSASGWSSSASASAVTFTGGSIIAGENKAFTVIFDAASIDDALTAWTITADDQSDGGSAVGVTAAPQSSISTGIDATAPMNVSIASTNADSATQVTATAASSTDASSGVHATAYWFDETTGAAGATDSTAWQGNKEYVDSGLTTGTQYCYKVKARDAVGNESAYSAASCVTPTAAADTTAPAAVTNLSASAQGSASIKLIWTAPGDDGNTGAATSYDVRYSTSAITESNWASATAASGEPTPQAAGLSESFTIGSLTSGTGYYFVLKTADESSNTSTISNIAGATTTAVSTDTSSPIISSVGASNITSIGVTISWTTNEIADAEVEFGSTASYGQSTTETSLLTSHTINLSNLSPGVTYHYRVRSRDASGNLATTGDSTFTLNTVSVSGTAPAGGASDTSGPIISDIIASSTYRTVIITWKTQESATARVELGKTSSYGTTTKETQFYANEHSLYIENLEPETEYHFRVISADLLNNSTMSPDQKFKTAKAPEALPPPLPPAPPPPLITEISVVSVRPTSARITWKTDLLSSSQIFFGTKPKEYTIISREFSSLVQEHDRTLADLLPGTTYYFQIVVKNERGIESRSEEGTFTTETIEIQTIIQIQKPNALPPGSPGTQTPLTVAGETTVTVSITSTDGDITAPEVTLFEFDENPTENVSPIIRGKAKDALGVIESIAYSSDAGVSWHPIGDVTGIGSSAAIFTTKIPNLRDGNYPILFRARDNSENLGLSNSRILIVDIKPPATGANIFLMGSQSIIPSEFGTIETLAGITQRFVTTAIGGATAVSLIAKKIDTSASSTPVRTHALLPGQNMRARGRIKITNTSAEAIRLIKKTRFASEKNVIYRIDEEITIPAATTDASGSTLPGSIEADVVADSDGEEFILKTGILTVPGLKDTDLFTQISATVLLPITVAEPQETSSSDQIEFPLVYSKAQDVWFGDILLPNAGKYETYVFAIDGAHRESLRSMNEIHVSSSGKILESKNQNPIAGVRVTVWEYSTETKEYQVWPGDIFNQANPQITGEKGEYRFILPPGKYYLKIEGDTYQSLYSGIFSLSEHRSINNSFSLRKKSSIASFSVPFIRKRISLPSLPDFQSKGVGGRENVIANPPKVISQLIGKTAPLFSLPDATTKNPVDIRYLRGKKTILSTWATWSPHAQIQIPILDAIARADNDNIRILLVSMQQSSGVVETYLRRGNYSVPSVVDTEGKITAIYPIFSLPQHFFIDRKGIIREVHIGFMNEETVKEKLSKL
ncbi:MAG: hypothetical protein G01um101448_27 [Parcubacteria group bacterium Gr01-1014_48]|nr:MAG: hypothetical protein Greene041614_389 [Parcubacteria group bacterium Greene0416_14]TSC74612.1 MAG: hypothetical protein G01um101448_27 [Parcubacteria group bacterium Gr01-1014_48]TSD01589.1 MAG: hypothetical protein Greene101415_169 [Parcubacteria group bacterium Greene1014_15]TSD08362.1 MAG: hypothetical protein Greene07144_157 [Parcubacteria group bacterium Greene0714_4]